MIINQLLSLLKLVKEFYYKLKESIDNKDDDLFLKIVVVVGFISGFLVSKTYNIF